MLLRPHGLFSAFAVNVRANKAVASPVDSLTSEGQSRAESRRGPHLQPSCLQSSKAPPMGMAGWQEKRNWKHRVWGEPGRSSWCQARRASSLCFAGAGPRTECWERSDCRVVLLGDRTGANNGL